MSNNPQKPDNGEVLDFDWGRITWLVARSLGNSETMTFGRVTIRAGRANPRHRHPNCDEILHLLSGRLEHSLVKESRGSAVLRPEHDSENGAAF